MSRLKEWHAEMTADGLDLRDIVGKTVCRECVQDLTCP